MCNLALLFSKQDVKLREAVALYKGQGKGRGVNWEKVCSHMGGTRSSNQCNSRWHFRLKRKRPAMRGKMRGSGISF